MRRFLHRLTSEERSLVGLSASSVTSQSARECDDAACVVIASAAPVVVIGIAAAAADTAARLL
jgi:hypothetical protein